MVKNKKEKAVKKWEYLIGFLSFLPIVGFVFGVIAIVKGALKVRFDGWKLISMAIIGMAVSVCVLTWIPGLLISAVDKKGSGDFGDNLAKKDLFKCVEAIEFYHLTKGNYPASLDELKKSDPGVFVYDLGNLKFKPFSSVRFHYELENDKKTYYLFGVGKDGIPFTADDVLPDLSTADLNKIGYRPRPIPALTPEVQTPSQGK